ncbi:phosphatase PAP2 family protein [Rheinheimera gaetbuli]
MFETDWIIWLQQGPQWLLPLMQAISFMGNDVIYMPVIVLLIFAVRVKPGLQVMLALVVVGAMVVTTKEGFALPRPADIDAGVLNKGEPNQPLVADGAAKSFFALPDADAIATIRSVKPDSYGFISGHTANAAALVLAMLYFYGIRSYQIWLFALSWPLLMLMSRMYLGRHFLADVLAGLVAAIAAVVITIILSRQLLRPKPQYFSAYLLVLLCLAAISLSPYLPWLSAAVFGSVIGALLCLLAIYRFNFHTDTIRLWQRPVRFVLALIWAASIDALLASLYQATGLADKNMLAAIFAIVGYPLAIVGALWLCRHCRLSQQVEQTR